MRNWIYMKGPGDYDPPDDDDDKMDEDMWKEEIKAGISRSYDYMLMSDDQYTQANEWVDDQDWSSIRDLVISMQGLQNLCAAESNILHALLTSVEALIPDRNLRGIVS